MYICTCKSTKIISLLKESIVSKKDVTNNQATIAKNQTSSTTTKFLLHGKETAKKNEENDTIKSKSRADANKNSVALKTKTKLVSRSTGPSTVQPKPSSLRAKNTTSPAESIRGNATSKTISIQQASKKPNAVLDTPHNVTVSSPPPKRNSKNNTKDNIGLKLNRKNSRTLTPEEIVVLKKDASNVKANKPIPSATPITSSHVKNPVAFEVQFNEKTKNATAKSVSSVKDKQIVVENNEIEQNYSDDFESYESDFENSSSSQSAATADSSGTESDVASDHSSATSSQSTHNTSNIDDSEDDSELTQNPITVIHKGNERKLDSGNYELNSRVANIPKFSNVSNSVQHSTDSLGTFNEAIPSDQLDSGISAYEITSLTTLNNIEITFGGYKHFYTKPIINQRGVELMSKTQFDILGFTFLELKPISYDVFMQTYGKLNTQQTSTQTQDNRMDAEQQTDHYETRIKWTQHPIHYDFKTVTSFEQICCGESYYEYESEAISQCKLEQSLHTFNSWNSHSNLKKRFKNSQMNKRKFVDYENLNAFLLRTSLALNQILSPPIATGIQNTEHFKDDTLLSRIADRYYCLETNFLNTLKVLKMFANNKYNILITVHESLPDTKVYNSDFSNLLMVWHTNVTDKPLRLLTTWSEISKIEISNDSSDIIVAGLRDGSLALWDLRETYSFCSKLDGSLTHFAATQSVVPSLNGNETKSGIVRDMGSCLDIKSFRSQQNNLQVQTIFPKTQVSKLLNIYTIFINASK